MFDIGKKIPSREGTWRLSRIPTMPARKIFPTQTVGLCGRMQLFENELLLYSTLLIRASYFIAWQDNGQMLYLEDYRRPFILLDCTNNGTLDKPLVEIRRKTVRRIRYHDHGRNEFFFQHNAREKKRVPTIILRYKSSIMLFLLYIWQLALLDEYNLLPIGILLYNIGIPMAIEEFSRTDGGMFGDGPIFTDDDFLDLDELRRRVLAAEFEYHVLRRQPNVKIVAMHNDDGSRSLFAM